VTSQGIQVNVRTFALVREAVGANRLSLTVERGSTVQDLLDGLASDYPDLAPLLDHVVVTVNQRYAGRDHVLEVADEVAVFPPVSGGTDDTLVGLTSQPIAASVLIEQVQEPGAGAIVSFLGVVRETHLGRNVEYLEYEAYAEMAIARLQQIADEIREQWPRVRRIGIVHRVGHLDVGETAVVVAVTAPHRDDGAFEAARYAIDRTKEIVPIWKKEVWSEGKEWIVGDHHPAPED
jgi:molybdopterin synthase catalytic subunit